MKNILLGVLVLGSLTAHALELPTIEPGQTIVWQGIAKCNGRYIGQVEKLEYITEVMADGSYSSETSIDLNGIVTYSEATTSAATREALDKLHIGDNCKEAGGQMVNIKVAEEIVSACKLELKQGQNISRGYYAGSSMLVRLSAKVRTFRNCSGFMEYELDLKN